MVGKPFQFQRDRPEPLRAQRRFGPRQSFEGVRISRRVSDGRVARHGFNLMNRRAMRAACKGALDASMLKFAVGSRTSLSGASQVGHISTSSGDAVRHTSQMRTLSGSIFLRSPFSRFLGF